MAWRSPSMERSSPMTSTPTTEVFVVFALGCDICQRHPKVLGVYTSPSKALTAARIHDEGLDVYCAARAVSGGRHAIDTPLDD